MASTSRYIDTGNSTYEVYLGVDYTTDYENNTSTYEVDLSLHKDKDSPAATLYGTYKIEVGGKTYSYTGSVNWASDTLTFVIVNSAKLTKEHNSSGDASVSVKITLPSALSGANGTYSFYLNNTKNIQVIELVAPDGSFDSEITHSCTMREYYSVVEKYYLIYSGKHYLISTNELGVKGTGTYTEKLVFDSDTLDNIYNIITDSNTATLKLVANAYSTVYPYELRGESTKEISLYIPDNESTKPTASLQITPVSSLSAPFDTLYVQRKSGLLADVINAEGKYGASIVSKEVVVLGAKGGAPFAVERLSASGDLEIKGTVTDSRGFKRTVTETVYVIPYSAPRILPAIAEDEVIVARCDAEGVLDDSGKYLKIKAKREYSKLEADGVQNNFCRIRYRYKIEGGEFSAWSLILASDSASDEVDTGALLDGGLLLDHSYIVQVQAIDSLAETGSTSVSVPTELVYLHKCGSRRSLGIGKYAEDSNTVDVAEDLTVKIRGEVEFLFEKWTSLGLSASVTASSESVGRLGGSDCAYLVRAGGRHIFVAFNCSFSGPVTINETQIPEEYRPSADIYGICPLAEHGYAIIRVGTDGFVSVVNITGPVNIDWIDGYIDYWI